MRLWSLHPKYLDRAGLIAVWREALLAQAVLRGGTRGYRHHPQLERFRAHAAPLAAIAAYLEGIDLEAQVRGYAFDRSKIGPTHAGVLIEVTTGQLDHEWRHLMAKLRVRDPKCHARWRHIEGPEPHPIFAVCPGDVAPWERQTDALR